MQATLHIRVPPSFLHWVQHECRARAPQHMPGIESFILQALVHHAAGGLLSKAATDALFADAMISYTAAWEAIVDCPIDRSVAPRPRS